MARDLRDIAKRKDAAKPAAAPACAAPPNTALAKTVAQNNAPPHPALVELVRLLAREAARKDIAAQRPNTK